MIKEFEEKELIYRELNGKELLGVPYQLDD